MKTLTQTKRSSGFTLMELMVAMAITTIIVTSLVYITTIASDTWNRSRSELRAARQAKAMVDTMARDFESLVTRRGNEYQWLHAVAPSTMPGTKLESTNAAELIFFSGAMDRYEGEIGGTNDKGGDVSAVAYQLDYRDPVDDGGTKFETFVLNRALINPDLTFENLLGQKDLDTAFGRYRPELGRPENFVCENIYQFTITFHVEVTVTTGTTTTRRVVPISIGRGGRSADSFKIFGTGIDSSSTGPSSVTSDQLKAGRLAAVEISLTVLSDAGIDQLRNRGFSGDQQSEFLTKHSYQYTKRVQLPSM